MDNILGGVDCVRVVLMHERIRISIHHEDKKRLDLTCTGHSKAGKVNNKIKHAEGHLSAVTSVVGVLNIIQAINTTLIISENVPQFRDSATKAILEGFLNETGYEVHEAILWRELGGF
mgnify:CR=1 FL=1|tara:strand:+ start:141 stop:494 length:354 start_codon:yes stop_codon:yes gene_type:complete